MTGSVLGHGDLADRIEDLTTRIESTPDDARLYQRRADLHRQHGDFDRALADLDRATALQPEWEDEPYARGRILLDARRWSEACDVLDEVCAARPEFVPGRLARARARAGAGREDAAAEYAFVASHAQGLTPDFFIEWADAMPTVAQSDAILQRGVEALGPLVTLTSRLSHPVVQNVSQGQVTTQPRVDPAVLPAGHRMESVRLVRGPYLQMVTPDSIVVRWRTDIASPSYVAYRSTSEDRRRWVESRELTTEHSVRLMDLDPSMTYEYFIGTGRQRLTQWQQSYRFTTSPPHGSSVPRRLWIIGDSGTADGNAAAVRDAYLTHTTGNPADLWLMLGDNAYNDGTDEQYQRAVFEMYPEILRSTPLFSTMGNHDGYTADSATQTGPYYEIFTLPTQGEAGGVASGTEAYYSFDYANIHFICLDSYETDRAPDSPMLTWLKRDLAEATGDWIIAFWHHPAYTKGSHDSDQEYRLIEMREYAVPILEAGGVDLMLSGHSHSYERSYLVDGHYGNSTTFAPEHMGVDLGSGRPLAHGPYVKPNPMRTGREGSVSVVAGSSGKKSGGSLDHPMMFISMNELGSLIMDVHGPLLEVSFLDDHGAVRDTFTIIKGIGSCPGDIDGDGTVGGGDLSMVVDAWAMGGTGRTDVSRDGITDGLDVQIILANWGEVCSGGG